MQKLNELDINLIIDALHRDAQRCDDIIEDQLIVGSVAKIAFYENKATKLRDIAKVIHEHAKVDEPNKTIIKALEPPKFNPHAVKVFSPMPKTGMRPASNPFIAKVIVPTK